MRTRYIVSYDVRHPKRLRKVFKVMEGFGDHLQYSVFSCDLSSSERVRCEQALLCVINQAEDQVLFIDLGPSDGRAREAIYSLGTAYVHPERRAIVV